MTNQICATVLHYFNQLPLSVNRAVSIAYISLAVTTTSANLALLSAMAGTKQIFSNTSNVLITSMSIVNFLIGFVSLPLLAYGRLNNHSFNDCPLQSATQFISIFLTYCSSEIVIIISIDRFLHMRTSLARRSFMLKLFNGRCILLPLLLANLFSLSCALSYMMLRKLGRTGIVITVSITTCLAFIAVPGISTLYMRGYCKVRSFVRKNPVYTDASCHSAHPVGAKRNESISSSKTATPTYLRRLQKTVFVLVTVLIVTYVPYSITAAAHALHIATASEEAIGFLIWYDLTILLFLSNFTLNSLVVFKMNRRAYSWLLRRVRCHNGGNTPTSAKMNLPRKSTSVV